MKLFSLLLIAALCAISSVECGCRSEKRKISTRDARNHVLCVQLKKSNCLHCKANGNYIKCDTKPAKNSDPASENGPAPNGYYAIGSVFWHKRKSISCANLYPQKQNGKGWWDYYRNNPDTGRSHIGLHPGVTSLGCVTVTDQSCWNRLERMLNSKKGDTITVSKTWGRTDQVNRVGVLRVMN